MKNSIQWIYLNHNDQIAENRSLKRVNTTQANEELIFAPSKAYLAQTPNSLPIALKRDPKNLNAAAENYINLHTTGCTMYITYNWLNLTLEDMHCTKPIAVT